MTEEEKRVTLHVKIAAARIKHAENQGKNES
jgi:hypothetical protein